MADKRSSIWPGIVLLCMAACAGFGAAHVMVLSPHTVATLAVNLIEAREDSASLRDALEESRKDLARVTAERDKLAEHLADLEGLAGRLDRIEVALTGGACPVTEAHR